MYCPLTKQNTMNKTTNIKKPPAQWAVGKPGHFVEM
jgi:hypothetical protein